jgi:hypothetical protein
VHVQSQNVGCKKKATAAAAAGNPTGGWMLKEPQLIITGCQAGWLCQQEQQPTPANTNCSLSTCL